MGTIYPNNKVINICGLISVGLLIAFAYKITLLWMYQRYISADSYYSHGFFVPLIVLFFIYREKERLIRVEQKSCTVGLFVIVFALFLHIMGTVLYFFSISGFSLFFLAAGLCLFLFGMEITKIIRWPLFFLIFMFPLPMAFISLVSFPMKIFAARMGVWFVSTLGIPIHAEGFNLYIPAGHLLVGNPCSGMRSLIAFLAFGAVLACLTPISTGRKWFLFCAVIPVALLTNAARVIILILVSHYWGLGAAAPDTIIHIGSGVLVVVVGALTLLTLARVLE